MAPRVEQELAVPRALDPLHELRRDDLVGVDGHTRERDHDSGEALEWLHYQSRMSTKCPAMAAAAAICGLTRCVRPPLPWRPSKLRLEEDAQRSPGWSTSGFIPGTLSSRPRAIRSLRP